jgi:hypothetical protein
MLDNTRMLGIMIAGEYLNSMSVHLITGEYALWQKSMLNGMRTGLIALEYA